MGIGDLCSRGAELFLILAFFRNLFQDLQRDGCTDMPSGETNAWIRRKSRATCPRQVRNSRDGVMAVGGLERRGRDAALISSALTLEAGGESGETRRLPRTQPQTPVDATGPVNCVGTNLVLFPHSSVFSPLTPRRYNEVENSN